MHKGPLTSPWMALLRLTSSKPQCDATEEDPSELSVLSIINVLVALLVTDVVSGSNLRTESDLCPHL